MVYARVGWYVLGGTVGALVLWAHTVECFAILPVPQEVMWRHSTATRRRTQEQSAGAPGGRPRVRFVLVIGRSRALAAGVTWTSRTHNAPWDARNGHTTVIDAAGAIYVLGGYSYSYIDVCGFEYSDVWVSADAGEDRTRAGYSGRARWYSGVLDGLTGYPQTLICTRARVNPQTGTHARISQEFGRAQARRQSHASVLPGVRNLYAHARALSHSHSHRHACARVHTQTHSVTHSDTNTPTHTHTRTQTRHTCARTTMHNLCYAYVDTHTNASSNLQ